MPYQQDHKHSKQPTVYLKVRRLQQFKQWLSLLRNSAIMIDILTREPFPPLAKQQGVERGPLFSDSAKSIYSDVYSRSSFQISFIFLRFLG